MRWLLAAIAALFATAVLAQAVPPSGPDGIACAYNSALPTLTSGQAGWVQCDANGRLISAPLPAGTNIIGATTTPPCTLYGLITAATTNSTSVSSTAKRLCWISAINTTATIVYVRLYDSATAPTCSSATGAIGVAIPVPANAAGAGFSIPMPQGVTLTNGLAFCITGGGTSTDNTSAVANVYVNLAYAAS